MVAITLISFSVFFFFSCCNTGNCKNSKREYMCLWRINFFVCWSGWKAPWQATMCFMSLCHWYCHCCCCCWFWCWSYLWLLFIHVFLVNIPFSFQFVVAHTRTHSHSFRQGSTIWQCHLCGEWHIHTHKTKIHVFQRASSH